MPADATVEDVEQLHLDSWKMGLKAVAIYRDNSKVAQPLSMAKKEETTKEAVAVRSEPTETIIENRIIVKGAVRRELPRVRTSRTYRFEIADLEGFFTVGEFEDGTPGELFVNR